MKRIFDIPIIFSNQDSFVEKGREAFALLKKEDADKFFDQVVSSYNNSAKMLDRYTFWAYVFAFAFYFTAKGSIKIENIAFVIVTDPSVIPSTFPFMVLFLTSFALMHFVYAHKLYFMMEAYAAETKNGLYIDKLFIFSLNMHSFTYLCESSRYNKYSLGHCLRHLAVFALFLGFVFSPNIIIFNYFDKVINAFDEKNIDYFRYVYYGLAAGLILFASVLYVLMTDMVGRKKAI